MSAAAGFDRRAIHRCKAARTWLDPLAWMHYDAPLAGESHVTWLVSSDCPLP